MLHIAFASVRARLSKSAYQILVLGTRIPVRICCIFGTAVLQNTELDERCTHCICAPYVSVVFKNAGARAAQDVRDAHILSVARILSVADEPC